ncbi:N-acetylserotonin O-methyltransferase [Hibiscus trionum]|uniref:N-acetylserotonin O-methyltransferase n=1 Tax=Hibiscus trionum TaxID=183268 RepID=A0A9W7M2B0_HIBTR|nr:N-acetylserotonin O-methyltransferase [Hibiscus trionum]
MYKVGNVNGEHVNELLQAQAHVWNHLFSFVSSMSLKCAVDLGIPDVIQNHGKPMSITELATALPTLNPSKVGNLYRLMRLLVHSGFFTQQQLVDGDDDQEQGYVLTNAARLLLNNHPLSITPYLKVITNPVVIKPWYFLQTWFENDDHTAFYTAHGETFWDYCSHDPDLINLFNESMANDTPLISRVLSENCRGLFDEVQSLVDVGGGTGTMAKAISAVFPHLECTVFDLPHVVAGLQDGRNMKYVGGNMFEAVPAADAIFLKWICHNWSEEDCLRILKRCKDAISERGKVIIIDIVVRFNDEGFKLVETQLFFDMLMMVAVNGRERREEEWAKLFSAAGFSNYKITPILGLRSLIEVYP